MFAPTAAMSSRLHPFTPPAMCINGAAMHLPEIPDWLCEELSRRTSTEWGSAANGILLGPTPDISARGDPAVWGTQFCEIWADQNGALPRKHG